MAVANEVRTRKLKALQIRDHLSAMKFGLVHVSGVQLRTLAVLKSYCLHVRGPALRTLSVKNIGTPFSVNEGVDEGPSIASVPSWPSGPVGGVHSSHTGQVRQGVHAGSSSLTGRHP